jgi:hypothetical protein
MNRRDIRSGVLGCSALAPCAAPNGALKLGELND